MEQQMPCGTMGLACACDFPALDGRRSSDFERGGRAMAEGVAMAGHYGPGCAHERGKGRDNERRRCFRCSRRA